MAGGGIEPEGARCGIRQHADTVFKVSVEKQDITVCEQDRNDFAVPLLYIEESCSTKAKRRDIIRGVLSVVVLMPGACIPGFLVVQVDTVPVGLEAILVGFLR